MREAASIHSGAFSNYLRSFSRAEFVGRRDFRNCCCALIIILSTHRAKFEHGVEKEKENAQKAAGLSSIFVPIRKKVSHMGEWITKRCPLGVDQCLKGTASCKAQSLASVIWARVRSYSSPLSGQKDTIIEGDSRRRLWDILDAVTHFSISRQLVKIISRGWEEHLHYVP